MITGFQAELEVDDGGTGAASGSTSTKFTGLVTLEQPELDAQTFDSTELNQKTGGGAADPYEREEMTGLIKVGPASGELKYTKANYNRLVALLGKRGYTWILTAPDDQTSGTPAKLVTTFAGAVKKIGAVKYENKKPVSIPFTLVVRTAPAFT